MRTIIFILGLIVLAWGIVFLIKPNVSKRMIRFWAFSRLILLGAIIKLAVGILFLIAARECKVTWLIVVFGLIGCLQGIVFLAMQQKKRRAVMEWLLARSLLMHRVLGVATVLIGAAIAYGAGIPSVTVQ
ncbi:MAG: hypothetical protein JW828_06325 [Sedimentisphaerales bacterium]|nr:hypothetical protein [Sedimentisphaerales bacterium]